MYNLQSWQVIQAIMNVYGAEIAGIWFMRVGGTDIAGEHSRESVRYIGYAAVYDKVD